MLLSLKWLREFVPFEGSAQELGDRLTMLGLELEELAHPYDSIGSIVVGHVITCEQHPDSDHMHVCTVDAGQGELLTIVCGAPNVAQGQKVPVALVGTTMPNGLQIKKAKLRGVPSFGMICSERELGLSEDHNGIMVLPATSPVGARLVDVLDLDTEVLEIGITPNRADCLSVLGLARETALAFHLPLTIPSIPLVESGADIAGTVPLCIADPELCWLYSGRIIENVHVQPSPMRVRHRLHAVGVRPISNIVDVTNYILMELGQPLHSFDLAKLQGGITVAPAVAGEKLITLDEQERELCAADLTIRDQRGAVALAGVMGGLSTAMTEESSTVFLESALFKPAVIRKTSRRLGLSSEASYRFERGVDQQGCLRALDRAAALMAAWSDGSVRKGICKLEPKPFVAPVIPFRPARADAVLGVKLSEDFSQQTFAALGCPVQKGEETWQVTAPSWRYDLSREADLIEEVGRVHGLDTIPPVLPQLQRALNDAAQPESPFNFWMRVKRWGKGLGLNEAVNYSFVGHKDLDHLHLPQEGRISIMNPLSAEQDALRTALAPGLLQNLRTNIAQGAAGLRLFELAHVFAADASSDTTAKETSIIGFLLYGNRYDSAWPQREEDVDYTDLKGIVAHLFAFLHIGGMQCALASEPHPYLLPCVNVMAGGQTVGVMGRVRPEMADAFHARKDVWLAELNLDTLSTMHHAAQVHFSALPVFPPVRRDITVIAPATLPVQAVLDYVAALKLPLLETMQLIDLFEPEQAEERNITFRLTFRHAERTLKDAEVDKVREKIAAALVKDLPVRI